MLELKHTALVVGIAGPKGSGKTTLKHVLWERLTEQGHAHGVQVIYQPLAAPLKSLICELLSVPHSYTSASADKESPLACGSLVDGLSPRRLFQIFGTETMRESFGQAMVAEGVWSAADVNELWVRVCERAILRRIASGTPVWESQYNQLKPTVAIVDDVRFHNEAAWVRSVGGIVLRVEGESADTHASEADISAIAAEVIVPHRPPDGASSEELFRVRTAREEAATYVVERAFEYFRGKGTWPFRSHVSAADVLASRGE